MPETTPLIKAALNLRGGAGFDVYVAAWSSGTGAGIVISMVFYGSHIILLSAAALQHYGH